MSLFKFSMGTMPIVYASGSEGDAAKYKEWLDSLIPGYTQETIGEVPLVEPLLQLSGIVDALSINKWEQIERSLPGLLILGHDYSLVIGNYTLGYYTTESPLLRLVAELPEDSIARRLVYVLEPSCVSSLFVLHSQTVQEITEVPFEEVADILLSINPSAAIAKLSNRRDRV